MTRQSINEWGDPLKTKYLFLKKSDLHVAVQRAGPHPQPYEGRFQAYSNYIQPHPPTVYLAGVFVLVTKTPTILVTISTQTERRILMSPQTIPPTPTEHEIERARVTHV